MNYYLAIDIGASGGRHILGYISDNKLICEEIYRFDNAPIFCGKRIYWDIERLFDEIIFGIKKAKELDKIPTSIAIDTWGVDYVLLDKNGLPIKPYYCYRDLVSSEFINTKVPFEDMYAKTGIQRQPYNSVYQLLRDKSEGRLANAEHMLMLPEYFSYLLTGVMGREYTNATTTGLVNANSRTWDYDLIDQLELPKKLFAPLYEPPHRLARLSDKIIKRVGYDADVLFVASHDTASAVLALSEANEMYISSGTWSLIGVESLPILGHDAMQANFSNEGSINNKIRFQKNIMGMWIIQNLLKESGANISYGELAQLAQKEADYDYDIDINDEAFFAPESMTRTVQEACKNANQKIPQSLAELANCVYLSLAKAYKRAFLEVERLTKRSFDKLMIIGGGSKNNYLNQLCARELKRSVFAGPHEATATGNLLMQIISNKNCVSLEGIRGLISSSFDIKEIKSDV